MKSNQIYENEIKGLNSPCMRMKSKDLRGDSQDFVIWEIMLQSRFIIVKKDYAIVLRFLKNFYMLLLHIAALYDIIGCYSP